jgi:hypothetical protein
LLTFKTSNGHHGPLSKTIQGDMEVSVGGSRGAVDEAAERRLTQRT